MEMPFASPAFLCHRQTMFEVIVRKSFRSWEEEKHSFLKDKQSKTRVMNCRLCVSYNF